MNGAAGQGGGGGGPAVSTPPKPAPKPKPLSRIPSGSITPPGVSKVPPSPSTKPTVPGKQKQPPPVLTKPKPGSVPVPPSPKPEGAIVSPKPKVPPPSLSPKPKLPPAKPQSPKSPLATSQAGLTNGGSPPPVKPKVHKPPVKRKSWITSPQQSFESPNCPPEVKAKPDLSKDHSNEQNGEIDRDGTCLSDNKVEAAPVVKPRTSVTADIAQTITKDISPAEEAGAALGNVSRSERESAAKTLSEEESVSQTPQLTENTDLAVGDGAISSSDSPQVPEPSQESVPQAPPRDILKSSPSSAVSEDTTNSADQDHPDPVALPSLPLPGQSRRPGGTEPGGADAVSADDTVEDSLTPRSEESSGDLLETESSLTRGGSVASTISVASSVDSYDVLGYSKSASSFKSQRSSHSVRSVGSSRRGSDSEDECGTFDINPEIPEEEEEDGEEEAEGPESREGGDEIRGVSIQERESVQSKASLSNEEETQDSTPPQPPAPPPRHSLTLDNASKHVLLRSVEKDSVSGDDEQLRDSETLESSDDQFKNICGTADPLTGSFTKAHAGEGQVSQTSSEPPVAERENSVCLAIGSDTSFQINGVVSDRLGIDDSAEPVGEDTNKSEENSSGTQEAEEREVREAVDEEEDPGEEEEFDEMGKRIFSFSRKKKKSALKYSAGEFHEQYETSRKGGTSQDDTESKDVKQKLKKGKKSEPEIEDIHDEGKEEIFAEERPSKPPRMRPSATAEELEVGRSSISDVSTSPLPGERESPRPHPPRPAPRLSLTNINVTDDSKDSSKDTAPVPSPRKSLSSRSTSTSEISLPTSVLPGDRASVVGDEVFHEEQPVMAGSIGAIVTRVDTDGEEEMFIGGLPSSATQTAFADQDSVTSSSAAATEVEEASSAQVNQTFHHFATIEPVAGNVPEASHPATEAETETKSATPVYSDSLMTSDNPSISISNAESEPRPDDAECGERPPEHPTESAWNEMAAVKVGVTSMPEPLVPEFTHIEGDSSTSSTASSVIYGPAAEPLAESLASAGDQSEKNIDVGDAEDEDEDDDDDDEELDDTNLYDQIDIYDDSYKKKDWKYRESAEELSYAAQPVPENDAEAAEAKDTISEISGSSNSTTASELEFRASFGSRPHRIQRRTGSEDFVRLSKISRERTVTLYRQDGTYGLRIQKSKPVVITNLDSGGPGENAGLKMGDMIVRVNGKDVRQAKHSEVVKLASEAEEPLVLVVGTVVCNSLNFAGDKIIMSGFMHRQASTGVIKQWRRRWFVLKHDNCLYYYKTETDILPQGAIVLQNYTVTKARDAGKQFSFKLTKVGARTHYFYTSSDEEMSRWGKAISEAANPERKSDIWLDISTHNVSLPALSIKEPECQGILTKWNSKMRNPRRRYCILKDACLYYYKDMNALQAQGVVHLHGYSLQEMELKGKKFAFTLKPPSSDLREFYFCADHETDRKRWVAALASSIGRWIQTNVPDDGEDDTVEMII
ncbi:uncharacterized protein [Diadema antillarum]|uniref:uncharacterized protein n=1 Tax=Diadema antillarum TaxID=105358 RepID=UPI003A83F51F